METNESLDSDPSERCLVCHGIVCDLWIAWVLYGGTVIAGWVRSAVFR